MYSQCVISVFVAQYITAMFLEPPMTSNRYPAERFGRAQNGPTFDRQNTIFAASKLLDEIASGRVNPNIWDHWGINKHIRQNYFLVHIHFKRFLLRCVHIRTEACLNMFKHVSTAETRFP